MTRLQARVQAWMMRLRTLFRREQQERELAAELREHLALHIEENLRAGMPPDEARRVAHARLGGVEQVKERCREIHPFRWLDTCWLDIKLGLRMLRRSWGLTLVGGFAMTVAIGIGAAVFAVVDTFIWATLPLDDGHRVVAIQTWDATAHRRHETALADVDRWRDGLRSMEDVGAFRTIERSLVTTDGPAELVSIAEMTASGFRLARVPPLLGRPLVEADEREDASPVVVIGYDVWQSRFSTDPTVVGQTVRLGATVHTVVGVMPEGFAFPVNHQFWTPLRGERLDHLPPGPGGVVVARLAPGFTLEGAQAELTTLGLLPPAAGPETDAQLHPRVVPYTFAFTGDFERGELGWVVRLILLLVTLLLVPPCANIAILVYARTVTRQEEFAARYALGATRGRIVGQLFLEVLVLAAGAAGVALVLVREAFWRVQDFLSPELRGGAPFGMDFTLSPRTVLFAAGLAVVAAMIAGVVPALKATGREMQSGLRALGSRTGMQLGGTWTALVVAQVAFSIAALPVPNEARWTLVEIEDVAMPDASVFTGDHVIRSLPVDDAFFDVFDLPLLTGRGFEPGDFGPARAAVIVNRTFVDTLLGDGNPLGRRVRYFSTESIGAPAALEARWYEIVGVVDDLFADTRRGTMFHPAAPGQIHPMSLALRLRSDTAGVTSRLREITAALDPALRVDAVRALDAIHRQHQQGNYLGAFALATVTLSVLLLSAAGMYALMSFTVNQRRREIGIRSALGAPPRRLLAGIFRRAVGQLAAGTLAGVLVAFLLDFYIPAEEAGGWNIPGIVPAAAGFMMVVGLLAATGPARRGLRIDPTEALRDG